MSGVGSGPVATCQTGLGMAIILNDRGSFLRGLTMGPNVKVQDQERETRQ